MEIPTNGLVLMIKNEDDTFSIMGMNEYQKEFFNITLCTLSKQDPLKVTGKRYRREECWHRVCDSLPEVGEKVLVISRNGKIAVAEMRIPKDCYGKVLGDKEWKGSVAFADSIVAWMPVPPCNIPINEEEV